MKKSKLLFLLSFLLLVIPVMVWAEDLVWTSKIDTVRVPLGHSVSQTISTNGGSKVGFSCVGCRKGDLSHLTLQNNADGTATLIWDSKSTDKPGSYNVEINAYDQGSLESIPTGSVDTPSTITTFITFFVYTSNDELDSSKPTTTLLNGLESQVGELNKLNTTDVNKVIGRIIRTVMSVMGSVALVLFVYGGVLWMISAGNAERAGEGRKILIWASLGLIVILGSYGLVDFVFQAFQ